MAETPSGGRIRRIFDEMNSVPDFALLASQRAADAKPHSGIVNTSPNRFNRNTAAYPTNLTSALDHFLRQPPVEGHSWVW